MKKVYTVENNKWQEQYRQFGYAILQPKFPNGLLKQALQDIQNLLDQKRRTIGTEDNRVRETEADLHLKSDAIKEIISSDIFAYVSQTILGNDADLRMCFTLTKTAEYGGPIAWHQDWGLDTDPGHERFSFWIPVTKTTISNGCLKVIPKSHLGPLLSHKKTAVHPFDIGIEDFEPTDEVELEMEAGETLLIHPRLIHGSGPFYSGNSRVVILGSYQKPKGRYNKFWANAGMRFLKNGKVTWERLKIESTN